MHYKRKHGYFFYFSRSTKLCWLYLDLRIVAIPGICQNCNLLQSSAWSGRLKEDCFHITKKGLCKFAWILSLVHQSTLINLVNRSNRVENEIETPLTSINYYRNILMRWVLCVIFWEWSKLVETCYDNRCDVVRFENSH